MAERSWQKSMQFYGPKTHSTMYLEILTEIAALLCKQSELSPAYVTLESALNTLLEGRHMPLDRTMQSDDHSAFDRFWIQFQMTSRSMVTITQTTSTKKPVVSSQTADKLKQLLLSSQNTKDLHAIYTLWTSDPLLVPDLQSYKTNIKKDSKAVWRWRWSSQPTSHAELQQLADCNNILHQIQITTEKDCWCWSKEADGVFTVASMRRLLFQVQDSEASNEIIAWNNWIPQKVVIFGWRAMKNRIPTKSALSIRGVKLQSNLCSICGDIEESAEHLLISCSTAAILWQFIGSWLKIPPIFAFSVLDLLKIHDSTSVSDSKKKVIQAIILTACWSLWKARNRLVFDNVPVCIAKIRLEIKSQAYSWIKNRSPLKTLSWSNWRNFTI